MNVARIAAKPVVNVNVADSCDKAVALMEQHHFRHLPVLEDEAPVGMLSERDVLFHLYWLGSDGGVQTIHEHVASFSTPVGEIMSTPLIAVSPEASLNEATWLMLQEEVRSLPLVSQNRLEGLVTEADLLKHFADDAYSAWRQRLAVDYMARHVVSVPPEKSTLEALRLMGEEHVRHLPVMDEGRLIGVVSDRDIFRGCARDAKDDSQLSERLQRNQQNVVENVMTRQVESADPSMTLAQAVHTLTAKKIGSLPIVDGGNLLGLLTKTDILRALLEASEE